MAPPLDNIVVGQIASLSILFVLATGIFGLRLFTRIVHSMTYRLLLDDYCIIIAWILFATQLFLRVAVLNATSLVPVVLLVKRNADMSHAAGVMANVAWSLAKTSFIFTLLRLVTGKLRWLLWFIMVTMNVTVATWVPLFENPCGPRSHLPCMTGRQALDFAVFASAYSVFLDFLLSLLPWKIIWPLHLSTKDRVGICVAMSMGFGAGATGIVKIFHLFSLQSTSAKSYSSADKLGGLFIWESAEIAATIMAASIPVLRKLSLSRRRHSVAPNMRENQEGAMRSSFRRQLRMVGLGSQVTNNTTTTQAAPPTILGSTREEVTII
ncbi:hypothetical protein CORC01_09577 [Colletotrichum orchidophilum]|uniref:Rhodopsin domain-containing protein n=1 Tax=Colletotrichum orchidophilum TaxID=1209926 RepID=A0A1G4B185_9PEZI|nr:uncharacterized protein CORC01_09577 [Colletotrichum orchidophilum]OHE95190.1 hypothetical protein CORC01_09577 [Colletotrichum orchidophilum]